MASPESSAQAAADRPRAWWTILEPITWGLGLAALAYWAGWYVTGVTDHRQAMFQFALLRAAESGHPQTPDQTLWSPERISGWTHAQALPGPTPIAVIRIPRIHVEAPILEGTDDVTLNRGVGHIADTAVPGADGNSGIAGHRDGFFRGLKDIAPGDVIEIETPARTETYKVERTWIVSPDEVSVLDPTPVRSITLVTCYPFYFIGSAPQRFIVRAVRADERAGVATAAH